MRPPRPWRHGARNRVQRRPCRSGPGVRRQGFDYLHVVDLDGAFAGQPVNAEAVRGILAQLTIKLQLGGGIRDLKTVRGWLEGGVTRVIVGTAAVRDPDFVREAARLFPGRIAVGVDAREGVVAIDGWAKTSDISALDLARRFQDAGVAAIIYTDIARDGALAGLNLEARSRSPRRWRFQSSPRAASPRSRM